MSSTAERIPFEDAAPPRALRKRVEEVLAAGGLVALPTETVYGIAARADSEAALARLRAAKGRDGGHPFTWHVATREAIEPLERLGPVVRRLTGRYWPGPLTLVLEHVPPGLESVASDGWLGVRLPAHRGTAGLLTHLSFPVVATSVNATGEPPLLEPDAIVERFGEALELVLDGGPARLGEASGVLRVGRGRFELLREGLLPVEDLRRTAGLTIGFCCTGNTCRSPMAEGLARALLAERLGVEPVEGEGGIARFGFRIASMGAMASLGAPASPHAVDVLRDEGIDISAHRSRPAIAGDVAALDRVYCLTPGHLDALRHLLPPGRDRNLHLLDPDGHGVPDPIGGSREDYRRCMEAIRSAIRRRAADWA